MPIDFIHYSSIYLKIPQYRFSMVMQHISTPTQSLWEEKECNNDTHTHTHVEIKTYFKCLELLILHSNFGQVQICWANNLLGAQLHFDHVYECMNSICIFHWRAFFLFFFVLFFLARTSLFSLWQIKKVTQHKKTHFVGYCFDKFKNKLQSQRPVK